MFYSGESSGVHSYVYKTASLQFPSCQISVKSCCSILKKRDLKGAWATDFKSQHPISCMHHSEQLRRFCHVKPSVATKWIDGNCMRPMLSSFAVLAASAFRKSDYFQQKRQTHTTPEHFNSLEISIVILNHWLKIKIYEQLLHLAKLSTPQQLAKAAPPNHSQDQTTHAMCIVFKSCFNKKQRSFGKRSFTPFIFRVRKVQNKKKKFPSSTTSTSTTISTDFDSASLPRDFEADPASVQLAVAGMSGITSTWKKKASAEVQNSFDLVPWYFKNIF